MAPNSHKKRANDDRLTFFNNKYFVFWRNLGVTETQG